MSNLAIGTKVLLVSCFQPQLRGCVGTIIGTSRSTDEYVVSVPGYTEDPRFTGQKLPIHVWKDQIVPTSKNASLEQIQMLRNICDVQVDREV